MRIGAHGLLDVSTSDLKRLLHFVYQGEIALPITPAELARVGLQHATEALNHLRGLDAQAVTAVLVAVLAERTDTRHRA